MTPTPGQVAYDTYLYEMENTAPAGSLRWEAQEGRVRDAWEAAAQAVLGDCRRLTSPQEETPDA